VSQIADKLQGGDRRSIGRVPEVVAEVLSNPDLFGELMAGMQHPDTVVRMRAADAAEKVSAAHPDYLSSYTDALLHRIGQSTQQEVRWHVAQMLPRLALSADKQTVAVALLYGYLKDRSAIVQTFALDALATFAHRDATLRPEVMRLLDQAQTAERAAVRSRAKKLLAVLNR
jgi:hypothetical protein